LSQDALVNGSGNSCNQGLFACFPSPKAVEEYNTNSKSEDLVTPTKALAT